MKAKHGALPLFPSVLRAALTAAALMAAAPLTLAERQGLIAIELESQPLKTALEIVSTTYDVPILAAGDLLQGRSAP
ncbi:MAG: hypothetical protein AAGL66_12495, partial [Pseudomonadota bacterium]